MQEGIKWSTKHEKPTYDRRVIEVAELWVFSPNPIIGFVGHKRDEGAIHQFDSKGQEPDFLEAIHLFEFQFKGGISFGSDSFGDIRA